MFVGKGGRELLPNELGYLLIRLKRRAGVQHFAGVRVYAHTFAVTYMAQPGADIFRLSLLLGHSGVQVTQNYLRDFQQRAARRGPSVLDAR